MENVIHGNNLTILKTLETSSIDSIVTDPPYGINFLGKDWDANTGTLETYEECLRVLKPGGHLLAFSAARTYHHLAITLEQAGFEIRDQLMWLYGSGFPKAQDIGKAIDKRGGMVSNNENTKSLKTILAKLFKASGKTKGQINDECGFNAAGYLRQHDNGVDGWGYALPLNDKWLTLKKVLGCGDEYDNLFISSEREKVGSKSAGCFDKEFESHTVGARSKTIDITAPATESANKWNGWKTALKPAHEPIVMARKPFKGSSIDNVLEHGVGALNVDASSIKTSQEKGRFPSNVLGEVEGYQKYFYCPKVSRKERHCEGAAENNHPTVKPVALMEYLITLVTPKEGTVLDPFMGSGSTGMAACGLGYNFIGIDLDSHYCQIAETRIEAWCKTTYNDLFE